MSAEELKNEGKKFYMRNIDIPIIYDAVTGDWLIVCSLKYDKNNEIVEVGHWNGECEILYEKGKFEIEDKVKPLYQEDKNEDNDKELQ